MAQILLVNIILLTCVGTGISFDMLKLVEQWPKSTCNVGTTCIQPLPRNFTIHGLWPDLKASTTNLKASTTTSKQLVKCTATPFDISQVVSLEKRLKSSWPNLMMGKRQTNRGFWDHEWVYHGTCSESTFNQHSYFELTLNLKDRLDLVHVLAKAKITPGKSYPAIQIFNAIEQEIHTKSQLRCDPDDESKKQPQLQLHEIVLCYDKDGVKRISCLTNSEFSPLTNCHGNIEFPS